MDFSVWTAFVAVSTRGLAAIRCGRIPVSGGTILPSDRAAAALLRHHRQSASTSLHHALSHALDLGQGLTRIHSAVSRALIARTHAYRLAGQLAGVDKHEMDCIVAVAGNSVVNL